MSRPYVSLTEIPEDPPHHIDAKTVWMIRDLDPDEYEEYQTIYVRVGNSEYYVDASKHTFEMILMQLTAGGAMFILYKQNGVKCAINAHAVRKFTRHRKSSTRVWLDHHDAHTVIIPIPVDDFIERLARVQDGTIEMLPPPTPRPPPKKRTIQGVKNEISRLSNALRDLRLKDKAAKAEKREAGTRRVKKHLKAKTHMGIKLTRNLPTIPIQRVIIPLIKPTR